MNQRYFFLCICCFLGLTCSSEHNNTAIKSHQSTIVYPQLPDSVANILQNGDIIIRKGSGPLSFHLSRTTGEDYTHCGIIVKANNKLGIIHTVGRDASHKGIDGVQVQSLKTFVSQSADSCLFICRPIFKPLVGENIVSEAKKYLKKKVPFDYGFSLLSADKFYCSELLYYVFKDVNEGQNVFHITKKNKTHILMFSTFFDQNKFEPIFNLRSN